MIDKTVAGVATAVADVGDVAPVMIGRFGTAGMPAELIDALIDELQRMSVVPFNWAALDDVVHGCANGAGVIVSPIDRSTDEPANIRR